MQTTVKVKGMSCNHCVSSVKKSLESLPSVSSVNVNLDSGEAVINHDNDLDMSKVRNEIEKAGYELG